jgi:predicted nucleic acid-binding protein
MLSDFAAIRITRHAMAPCVERVLELRANLSAYDAFYVAVAEASELPLLTRNLRFARAAGHTAELALHSD